MKRNKKKRRRMIFMALGVLLLCLIMVIDTWYRHSFIENPIPFEYIGELSYDYVPPVDFDPRGQFALAHWFCVYDIPNADSLKILLQEPELQNSLSFPYIKVRNLKVVDAVDLYEEIDFETSTVMYSFHNPVLDFAKYSGGGSLIILDPQHNLGTIYLYVVHRRNFFQSLSYTLYAQKGNMRTEWRFYNNYMVWREFGTNVHPLEYRIRDFLWQVDGLFGRGADGPEMFYYAY